MKKEYRNSSCCKEGNHEECPTSWGSAQRHQCSAIVHVTATTLEVGSVPLIVDANVEPGKDRKR